MNPIQVVLMVLAIGLIVSFLVGSTACAIINAYFNRREQFVAKMYSIQEQNMQNQE
jgi:H+/gluconate symporter-like permease